MPHVQGCPNIVSSKQMMQLVVIYRDNSLDGPDGTYRFISIPTCRRCDFVHARVGVCTLEVGMGPLVGVPPLGTGAFRKRIDSDRTQPVCKHLPSVVHSHCIRIPAPGAAGWVAFGTLGEKAAVSSAAAAVTLQMRAVSIQVSLTPEACSLPGIGARGSGGRACSIVLTPAGFGVSRRLWSHLDRCACHSLVSLCFYGTCGIIGCTRPVWIP